ncbi:dopamine receptor 3-like [Mercenaria mercenaria]|uniref:dopamine receptor 3-like n=1 Tax=Mercenaria mercenaria TaxID=6596 RepID=UPI00234E621D|nr:dopamine receptor 3-like [Mercenaria mercenaria]
MRITNTSCEILSNYTCWMESVREYNQRSANLMISVEVMMCLFMVVGILGNTLVLVVYSYRTQKTTANIFIMFLACMDLFACVVLHPYIIFKLFHGYDQTWTVLCKVFEYFNHCILALSGLTLCLVAIDRYLAICHPVKFLQFHKQVAKAITTISVISVIGSLPILEFYGATPTEIDEPNSTFVGFRCHYKLKYQNSTALTAFGAFILCVFMTEIITMIVLYKHVAVTAYRSRRTVKPLSNAHILAGIKPSSSNSETKFFSRRNETTETSCQSHDQVSRDTERAADVTAIFSVEPKVRKFEVSRVSAREDDMNLDENRKHISENRKFSSRLKAAKILFFVTAVFFLSWMPFFVLRICSSLDPTFLSVRSDPIVILETSLNHVFYLNNAINPIIYTLINKNFRLACKTFFKKHCIVRRR